MKKYLALIIIAVMGLTLICGCAKKSTDDEKASLHQDDVTEIESNNNDTAAQTSEDVQQDNITETETNNNDTATQTSKDAQQDDVIETQTNNVATATQPTETQQEDTSESQLNNDVSKTNDGFAVGVSIENLDSVTTDIFIGDIISSHPADDSDFVDIQNSKATPVLYTVSVQRVLKQGFVTEGTVINVVHYVEENSDTEYFADRLEEKKRYLFSGMAQPYSEKAVIVDSGSLISLIDGNQLIPKCSLAQKTLLGISSLADLESLSEFSSYCNKDTIDIPTAFGDLEQTNEQVIQSGEISGEGTTSQVQSNTSSEVTTDTKPIEEQVIAVIKEAIKVDSDVTIKEWQG